MKSLHAENTNSPAQVEHDPSPSTEQYSERAYYLHDIITDNVRWAADAPALIYEDKTYTWSDFQEQVEGLRRGLSALGVKHGTRVSILDRNSDRYVFLHYALASLGAILCPINMWLRAPEIAYILSRTQPYLIITSNEFRYLAGEAAKEVLPDAHFVTFGSPLEGDTDWGAIVDGPDDPDISSPRSWTDPHMILFTSGTTGRPKGAIISHKRTIIDGMTASVAFGIRRGERLYNFTPLFHTGSWDYFKMFFMNQGSVVLVDRFDADEAVDLIERYSCNVMFGVPLTLRKMLETRRWPNSDMSSMRVLAYGNFDAGNFLDDVLSAFRRRGAEQLHALFPYGLTEGGPFVTIARPDDTRDHPNCIGTPLPGVSVAIFDEFDAEVANGEVGEICVRSPALMSEYLDMPEETAAVFNNGWMHTGDLGRIDETGFLHMVDRKKDMVRTGAENVYASEVEQLLISHPDIEEVAVIGLPDPDYGEMVVAVVVTSPGSDLKETEIITWARARIAGFKTPRRVEFLSEFPRTVTGKVAKSELRTKYAETES